MLNLVESGEREAGRVGGRVRPALAFSRRCMAIANSSAVKRPSLSTSASSLSVQRVEGGGREGERKREGAREGEREYDMNQHSHEYNVMYFFIQCVLQAYYLHVHIPPAIDIIYMIVHVHLHVVYVKDMPMCTNIHPRRGD